MPGNPILDLAFAPWTTHAIFTATRLGVFTALAENPMAADELGARLGADRRIFPSLLNACVGMGLLHVRGRRYTNAHIADVHLVEGKPLYVGDLIEVMAVEMTDWQHLYDIVRQAPEAIGATPTAEPDPRRFTLAMNNVAMLGEAAALAEAVDLSVCRTMADVGCGSGAYSIAVCHRYPALRAVLLDRADVLETTREIMRRHNLENRIETRAADITRDLYGDQLDAVLLSDVLYHDESISRTILRSAHDAMSPGGQLIIRGYYDDPECPNSPYGAVFGLKLMVGDPGRELITLPKLLHWIEETPFHQVKTFPLTMQSTCITAVK
jgi:SAM-dependent methyltransferase